MFDRRILRLTPKRIFCPLCGNWHSWEGKELQAYSEDEPYIYYCNGIIFKLWLDNNCIYIQSSDLCNKVNTYIDDAVCLEHIESFELMESIIKFSILTSTDEIINSSKCTNCKSCNLPNIGDKRGDDDNEFELFLKFMIAFNSTSFNKNILSQIEMKMKKAKFQ